MNGPKSVKIKDAPETANATSYGIVVRNVARAFTRMLQDKIGVYGITAGEFRVLRAISDGGSMQNEIAQMAAINDCRVLRRHRLTCEKATRSTRVDGVPLDSV
jgi:hypothetical protein